MKFVSFLMCVGLVHLASAARAEVLSFDCPETQAWPPATIVIDTQQRVWMQEVTLDSGLICHATFGDGVRARVFSGPTTGYCEMLTGGGLVNHQVTIKGNEISARLFDGRELISWRTLNLRTGEVNTDQGVGNICRRRAG